MSAIIGIDLGTTNSCVAIYANGKPQILLNGEGDRTTPSVVTFRDDGGALVGGPAHRQAVMNPTKTITGVKRLVGRRFDSEEVFALRAMAPYEIVAAPNGDAWVQIGGRTMSPPEVQSYILQALRASASAYLGQDVTRAVITVPAYFDDAQRQATRDAAEIAGLEVARILNEPTAAALAHGYTRGDGRRLAVIDLGGGTFDITVMTVEDGMFEVLSTTGDMLLGGEDFDRVIASRLGEEIRRDHGFDAFADPVAAQRLMSEAESAKKQLTSIDAVTLSLPFFGQSSKGPINVERALTRAELEQLAQPLLARLAEPCRAALADAKLGPGAVDDVLLVGGMTRALCVQRCVAELFGKRPSLRINPDEAVALGAAIESGVLAGALEDVVLVDVAPHTIGLRVAGDRMVPLIPRQTPLPSRVTRVFSTTRDGQDYVEVEVVQGEAPKASHNRRLARVRLEGLPRAPKGQVKVAVTFKVDASGMLSVSAVDRASGRAVEAAVTAESGLARPEVMRIAHERARGGMRWS